MIPNTHDSLVEHVRRAIRDIPDFPKPGIVFKDITPLLGDADLFRDVVRAMADPFRASGITHVVAIESRGFLLGAPVAVELGAAVVPVRKPGKLPATIAAVEYALEYGTDRLEIHTDACNATARVLIVDDVLATGGTAAAAGELVRGRGAVLVGYSFLMSLTFLSGVRRLGDSTTHRLIDF